MIKRPKDPEDEIVRAILNRKEDFIRRHLVLSPSVIEALRRYDIIGQFTFNKMMANKASTDKQMTLLIVCLKARGLETFRKFLDVLRATFHGWIADDILEEYVDVKETSLVRRETVPVKDIINNSKSRDDKSRDKSHPPYLKPNSAPHYSTPMYYFYHPGFFPHPNSSWVRSAGSARLDLRHRYSRRDSISPIAQVPENLRELQRTLDNEATIARKSLTVLRQEEVTIKALLQQNMREQQDTLAKQEALINANKKIKEISDSTSKIFKPEMVVQQTRKRISALQRVPWNIK